MDRSLNPIFSSSCIKKLKAIITLILNSLNVYNGSRADNARRVYPCSGIAKLHSIGAITFIALSFLISFTAISYANETINRPYVAHSVPSGESAKIDAFMDNGRNFTGVQDELPKSKAPKEKREKWEKRREHSTPPSMGTLVTLTILATLVLIAITLYTLYRSSWGSSSFSDLSGDELSGADVTPEATLGRMKKVQMHADELAREGLFTEAMHLLLLQSVGELRNRLSISIAISLTSREILQTVSLASDGKSFFSDIIGRVESSYFGTYIPQQADYIACRESYDSLLNIVKNVQRFS